MSDYIIKMAVRIVNSLILIMMMPVWIACLLTGKTIAIIVSAANDGKEKKEAGAESSLLPPPCLSPRPFQNPKKLLT